MHSHPNGSHTPATLLISLVGEQPIPVLLPTRALQPKGALLVTTSSPAVQRVAESLERLLRRDGLTVDTCEVPPYTLPDCERALAAKVEQISSPDAIFNLTGGTKPMSLAAFRLAERRRAPVVYLQSEGGPSVLDRYAFEPGRLALVERLPLGPLLNLDDYLSAHGLSGYTTQPPKEPFEAAVEAALRPGVDELMRGICPPGIPEMDLLVRIGNTAAVAEVKSGNRAARGTTGINQLMRASPRELLGTYTRRFLILDRELERNAAELARILGIRVIVLPSFQLGSLCAHDASCLVAAVRETLGAAP